MRSAIDSSTRRSSSLSPAKRIAASKPGNLPRRKRTCRTPQPRLRRRLIQGGSFYPKPGGSITRNRAVGSFLGNRGIICRRDVRKQMLTSQLRVLSWDSNLRTTLLGDNFFRCFVLDVKRRSHDHG